MAYSGNYKGIRFRSLLELSLIRQLEGEGLVLGSTMLYEVTRIPYGRGGRRTYVVDLTLPQTRTLIEVKPLSRVSGRRNVMKARAAEAWATKNSWHYSIVTDRDIIARGSLLTLTDVAMIPEVRLDPRALRALSRRKRRRRKRAKR